MPQSILLVVLLLLSLYFFQYSVSLALVFHLSMSSVTGFCFRVPSGIFFLWIQLKSPFSFLYFLTFIFCSLLCNFSFPCLITPIFSYYTYNLDTIFLNIWYREELPDLKKKHFKHLRLCSTLHGFIAFVSWKCCLTWAVSKSVWIVDEDFLNTAKNQPLG